MTVLPGYWQILMTPGQWQAAPLPSHALGCWGLQGWMLSKSKTLSRRMSLPSSWTVHPCEPMDHQQYRQIATCHLHLSRRFVCGSALPHQWVPPRLSPSALLAKQNGVRSSHPGLPRAHPRLYILHHPHKNASTAADTATTTLQVQMRALLLTVLPKRNGNSPTIKKDKDLKCGMRQRQPG